MEYAKSYPDRRRELKESMAESIEVPKPMPIAKIFNYYKFVREPIENDA